MRARIAFGVADLVAAIIFVLGVFVGLPSRWLVVDVPALVAIALLTAAGIGLTTNATWGEKIARVASLVVLVLGLVLVALLLISASYLAGIYGPVGRGGAVIFVLVVAIAVPYLIVLPASQLVWLARKS